MKKTVISYLVIVSCLLSLSLQAADSVAAGLKGTYNAIPDDLQPFSPVHGAIIAENGVLKSIWQEESPLGDLARLMFKELDGNMHCATLASNPVSVLQGSLIKRIMDHHIKGGKPYSSLLPKSIIFLEAGTSAPSTLTGIGLAWWNAYKSEANGFNESYKQRDFKKGAKPFLRALDAASTANAQRTNDILIAFAYLKCRTPQDLQKFFKLFYPQLPSQLFTEDNFKEFETFFQTTALTPETAPDHVEQMAFWLLRRKAGDLHFLSPRLQYITFEENQIPLCVEGTIETIVNTLLYDPVTKRLSLSHLNPSLDLNPAFRAYIATHNNPHIKDYFPSTLPDWAALMTNIPGVVYKKGNKEIRALSENILTTLNFLFGTDATTFSEFGKRISSPDRIITFTNPTTENDSSDEESDDEDFGDGFDSDSDEEESSWLDDGQEGTTQTTEEPAALAEDSLTAAVDSETESSEESEEAHSTLYLTAKVSDHGFAPLLKIKINKSPEANEQTPELQAFGHAQASFANENSSTPTLVALDNMKLIGDLVGEDLFALFGIDWYKILTKFFKQKLFTTGPEFVDFLRNYHVTPAQIAAPSGDDDYILEDVIFLGRKDFIQSLIDFGVPIDHFPDQSDAVHTPLRFALQNKKAVKAGIPQLLMAHGATITPEQLNTPDQYKMKSLDYLLWKPYLPQVELLLQLGGNPNVSDKFDQYPLWLAVINDNVPFTKLLLNYGANPNISKDEIPLLGWTNNKNIIRLLLEHGANPNIMIGNFTPLIKRLWAKDVEAIKLLLEFGADPRIKSTYFNGDQVSTLDMVTSFLPELEDLMKQKAAELATKEQLLLEPIVDFGSLLSEKLPLP